MTEITADGEDTRTIITPNMVRQVREGSFAYNESLRSVVLNEGLEVLGAYFTER